MSILDKIAHDFEGKQFFCVWVSIKFRAKPIRDFQTLYSKTSFSDENYLFFRNFS